MSKEVLISDISLESLGNKTWYVFFKLYLSSPFNKHSLITFIYNRVFWTLELLLVFYICSQSENMYEA